MRKWINKHPYWVACFLVCAVLGMIAARPRGVSRSNSLWVAAETDTPTTTIDSYNGTHNAYISGSLEVDGLAYLDGGVSGTGVIDATNITDITRTITFNLASAIDDAGNSDIDDATEPNIATLDNVGAIVWDTSDETGGVQWQFAVPADLVAGVAFYALVSSDNASGSDIKLDWKMFYQSDDTTFGTADEQTAVACTSATLDASNEILTLTPDAGGLTGIAAADLVVVEVFNASVSGDTTELKGFWFDYTATQ